MEAIRLQVLQYLRVEAFVLGILSVCGAVCTLTIAVGLLQQRAWAATRSACTEPIRSRPGRQQYQACSPTIAYRSMSPTWANRAAGHSPIVFPLSLHSPSPDYAPYWQQKRLTYILMAGFGQLVAAVGIFLDKFQDVDTLVFDYSVLPLCAAQGYLLQIGNMLAFFGQFCACYESFIGWTDCSYRYKWLDLRLRMVLPTIALIVVSCTCALAASNGIGPAGPWCWIRNDGFYGTMMAYRVCCFILWPLLGVCAVLAMQAYSCCIPSAADKLEDHPSARLLIPGFSIATWLAACLGTMLIDNSRLTSASSQCAAYVLWALVHGSGLLAIWVYSVSFRWCGQLRVKQAAIVLSAPLPSAGRSIITPKSHSP